MKPRTALAVAVSVACGAPLLAGCRLAHDEVVAVVDGEYEIAAADVEYYVQRAAGAGGWPAGVDVDAVARELLDAAVLGKILELEAERRGYHEDPYVKEELAAIRSRTLRDYMRRGIDENVVVTEAEVLDFFEKSRKRRMYSFIQADEPGRAREAHAALEAGRPWDEVVAEYSTFAAYAGEGGKWDVPMEYAADETSKALFDLEVGEYTGVVEGADGLSWLRKLRRGPAARPRASGVAKGRGAVSRARAGVAQNGADRTQRRAMAGHLQHAVRRTHERLRRKGLSPLGRGRHTGLFRFGVGDGREIYILAARRGRPDAGDEGRTLRADLE